MSHLIRLAALKQASERAKREADRFPPVLQVGEVVRLSPESPWRIVVRVTPCAAYLRSLETKEVTIGEKTFTAQAVGIEAVSRRAFVERKEQEG